MLSLMLARVSKLDSARSRAADKAARNSRHSSERKGKIYQSLNYSANPSNDSRYLVISGISAIYVQAEE